MPRSTKPNQEGSTELTPPYGSIHNDVSAEKTSVKPKITCVVGLGASAGGLEALRPLTSALVPGSGNVYIVAQHMAPQYESILTNLLLKDAQISVVTAEHHQKLEPDVIYVTPPNKDISISRGRIKLTPASPTGPKPSIDALFDSIAKSYGAASVGVILSGTGSDGTHGCRSIKAAGGLVIVQDPKSAKHDGMPDSVSRANLADLQLSIEDLAHRLNHLSEHNEIIALAHTNVEGRSSLANYRTLMSLLLKLARIDFSQYKEATIERQIARRMRTLGIETLDDYVEYCVSNESELPKLAQNLLVSVTSFFRDPLAFKALQKSISDIIRSKSAGDTLRVWIPGCATGEEVYSVAMMIAKELGDQIGVIPCKIFATDIDQHGTDIARHGIYPMTVMDQVPQDLAENYLSRESGHFRITKFVRDLCIFSRHDLVLDPPFLRMDLIVCRNVMIYFKPGLQEEVFSRLHYALNPSGILMLGRSESLSGNSKNLFSTIDGKQRIYRKKQFQGSRARIGRFQPFSIPDVTKSQKVESKKSLLESIQVELLEKYAPPSVLLSPSLEPLQFLGDINRFLKINDGLADFSLFSLCPPALKTELRTLLQQVSHDANGEVIGFPVDMLLNETKSRVRLRIKLVRRSPDTEANILICFEEQQSSVDQINMEDVGSVPDSRYQEHISALQQELLGTREHLQAVLEEMHTTNEEFQSLNEELQSSSEELQASNEELQTTNEELQATNEELATINDELHIRSIELSALNETLVNIQNSIQVGLVILDTSLRVTRFTPLAVRLFGLLPGDIGHSLLSLPSYLNYPKLRESIEQVIRTCETKTSHIQINDTHYLMQISAYMSESSVCNGAVLAFTDITELRRVETALFMQEARFRTVFDNSPTSIWIADWSGINLRMNSVPTSTRANVAGFFKKNPALLTELLASISILEVNHATLAMFRASSKEEIQETLTSILGVSQSQDSILAMLTAYLVGKESFSIEMDLRAIDGDLINTLFTIVFPKNDTEHVIINISDLSELRHAKSALVESEARFDLILRTTPHGMIIVDERGRVVRSNTLLQAMLGYSELELNNAPIETLVPESISDKHSSFRMNYQRQPRSRPMGDGKVLMARSKSGQLIPCEISLAPTRIDNKPYVICNVVDVTDRVRVEEEIHERDKQYRLVIDTSPDGFVMTDSKGTVIEANESFCSRFGFPIHMFGECLIQDFIRLPDPTTWDHWIVTAIKDGSTRFETDHVVKGDQTQPIELTLTYSDSNGGRLYFFVRDISARKSAEAEIKNLANFDFLTGLPNRRLLMDRIRQAMAVSNRTAHYGAVLFIDIDNFKHLNDTMGHETGDLLLSEIAKRLIQCVRGGDTVARFGGDEFVVLLEGLQQNRDVAALQAEVAGSRILQTISQPCVLNEKEYICTPSIGISLFLKHETSVDDLLKQTDLAMYQAKAAGRNAMRFFDTQMQANIDSRVQLETELRKALQNDHLVLHYQPQVDTSGKTVGAEGLVRWNHPELGMIQPSAFIPIAEQTSLILALGQAVLREACRTLVRWTDLSFASELTLSVNVSARQFRAQDFVSTVQTELQKSGAPANKLTLELTESALLDDIEDTRTKIEGLRKMGVHVSLDDFGTGYSSLSYLKRLPIDQLKIDRSFVSDMLNNANDTAIVRALIALGNSMGFAVIAEGVESEEQWKFAVEEGCRGVQGFYFGKPMPLADLEDKLHFG